MALIVVYSLGVLEYNFKPSRPYPLFPWDLYSSITDRSGHFDIVIRALEPGVPLKQPLFLADLRKEYHEDWAIAPKKLIQRFGREVMLDPYSRESISTRKLIDNFLVDYPYAEYDLVHVSYDPYKVLRMGKYAFPTDLSGRVIHSFFKTQEGLP